MKIFIFKLVRMFHLLIADRGLPKRVALYCHSIEKKDYDALRDATIYFVNNGYAFCDMERYIAVDGNPKIALTLDDNYYSWYQALDVLEELEIKATFFTNTLPLRDRASAEEINSYYKRIKHNGEKKPLSVRELRAIDARGHVIGSHTRSHFMLTELSMEHAKEEIRGGKEDLENILGKAITHFSYPFGMRRHFSRELMSYCLEIGITTICSAIHGMMHTIPKDSFVVHRTIWHFEKPGSYNLANLRVDGRIFESLTGRNAVI